MNTTIATVIAASLLAGSVQAQWTEGLVSGVDTYLKLMIETSKVLGDYEGGTITAGVRSYKYENTTIYYFPGVTYDAQWRVFVDGNGRYNYSYILTANGAMIGTENTNPFEIGPSGQPLCKRQWQCEYHDPNTWYKSTAQGNIVLRLVHSVYKPALYKWNVPASFETQIMVGGPQLTPTCGGYDGPMASMSETLNVPHMSYVDWSNFPINVDVWNILGKVKM